MARVPQPPAPAGPSTALCWHPLPEVEGKKVWEPPPQEIPGGFARLPRGWQRGEVASTGVSPGVGERGLQRSREPRAGGWGQGSGGTGAAPATECSVWPQRRRRALARLSQRFSPPASLLCVFIFL